MFRDMPIFIDAMKNAQLWTLDGVSSMFGSGRPTRWRRLGLME
jgi:hypothetical protein